MNENMPTLDAAWANVVQVCHQFRGLNVAEAQMLQASLHVIGEKLRADDVELAEVVNG